MRDDLNQNINKPLYNIFPPNRFTIRAGGQVFAGLGNRTFWKCVNLNLKKCNLEIRTFIADFCTFALFQRVIVRSLVLKCEKFAIWKFCWHFFCTFALFRRAIVQSHFLCTFEKCDKKCNRTIALLRRATKSAIAQSHFWKEQKCAMCECAIAKPCELVQI